ncbi:MAG: hypothetical protein E7161_01095 [Firmicutes bacterium]|nr:hypothetical protein [Bacillota bacterium]
MKLYKKLKKAYKDTDKKSFAVYAVLRILVLLTFVRQLILGEWGNAFLCLLSLLLFLVPFFLETKFKITIPSTLEIIILIFIFSAEILGEINNFYVTIPHFDTLLHTLNGFLCAGIGFSLIDLLNGNSKNIHLSPIFVAVVAFCFSMTIGILWEFFEFGCDMLIGTDMQKDRIVEKIITVNLDEQKKNSPITIDDINKVIIYDKNNLELASFNGYLDIGIIDTMKDLLVNFVGAICFSIFGYLYILNRDKYKFVDHFIPTKKLKVIKE